MGSWLITEVLERAQICFSASTSDALKPPVTTFSDLCVLLHRHNT